MHRAGVAAEAVAIAKGDIRDRAHRFVERFADARSEQAERQTFWNEFMAIFGIDRRQVAAFEAIAERATTGNIGWIDLLYPGQMAVEHKSAGGDLWEAMGQLLDYLPSLSPAQHPWLLIACDFQRFRWKNLLTKERGEFSLADLPDNLDLFWWLAGYTPPHQRFENEEDANLAATELLAILHDRLRDNGYDPHDLREWLTRILFCLFADDTGVWDRAAFHSWIALRTRQDGTDLGSQLAYLFQLLNTAPERRPPKLDEDLAQFTYINGDLFETTLSIPTCDASIREALLNACKFDWAAISPAIFGSMFQNVMEPAERRHLGAHYTSEENILRTIQPLFLEELEAGLTAATTRPKLRSYLADLAQLTFFDPACGCGNFLVVAYREIRRLETAALRRLRDLEKRTGQQVWDITLELQVRVDQFYGIEVEEFPARIARTALYLIDHLANREVSAEFGQHYVRFPIPAAPQIHIGNALRLDWNHVLPAERVSYLFGNPPFIGFRLRTPDQQADLEHVLPLKTSRRVDYVLGWYAKAAHYITSADARCAFVSTNSITQGEQAPVLAGLFAAGQFTIDFAHRTFAWTSEARGKAHVHVVVIGFSRPTSGRRRVIYEFPESALNPITTPVRNINVYLVDGPDVIIHKRRKPFIPSVPLLEIGSKPNDAGHLIIEPDELTDIQADPIAARYLRPLRGSREFLQGLQRWCLWLADAPPSELRSSPQLGRRLTAVRNHRLGSSNAATRATASTPALFWSQSQPSTRYLAVPEVSSENRRVVPMGYLDPEVIATNKLYTIDAAPLWLFGVLQSAMFMAWARTVGGRLKSDISLSPGSVYNTFPFPDLDKKTEKQIEAAAQEILDARENHGEASLADLYHPLATPAELVKAHDTLDRVVDRAYAGRRQLRTEAARLAVLFQRYTTLAEPNALEARAW